MTTVKTGHTIQINAPHFFKDKAFLTWLNDGNVKATWHEPGREAREWSDTFVLVDPSLNGEGSDSDMPEHIWNEIVSVCQQHCVPMRDSIHIVVWLTNLEEV